ncbi:hypothetical protein CMEL01_02763 [Colletotrichum melonis]|nr:hypothetical protein CMEL01_02763 [Colletotrichum melonis]
MDESGLEEPDSQESNFDHLYWPDESAMDSSSDGLVTIDWHSINVYRRGPKAEFRIVCALADKVEILLRKQAVAVAELRAAHTALSRE